MAKFNVETVESGKSSVRVYPSPAASRGGFKSSATNPGNIGVSSSKKGNNESK